MWKPYRKSLLLTSLVTLLPIPVGLVLSHRFPQTMAVHFGLGGVPNGWAPTTLTIWGFPLMMLAFQWLAMYVTLRDPGNRGRNRKALKLVLWIIPLLGNLCCLGMYALALGKEFDILTWTNLSIGIMFIGLGNYLPKTKPNNTLGIRVRWVFTSEENWNATHRFAGWVWVGSGIAMVLLALLPEAVSLIGISLVLVAVTAAPVLYSRQYWKRQAARGDDLVPIQQLIHPAATAALVVALVATVAFTLFALFMGSLEFSLDEDTLYIHAGCYPDHEISLDCVDSVVLREDLDFGTRVNGLGNLRFQMGYFRNQAFGTYLRYTPTDPALCIVVQAGEEMIVLSGQTPEETRELYAQLIR